MVRLHAVQAAFGDCLLLEFGPRSSPRYILFDGGPAGTYEKHLQPVLKKVVKGDGQLELVVLTHVDNDHVTGLLDLFAELRRQQESGGTPDPQVCQLWHNSFAQTIDPDEAILPRVRSLLSTVRAAGIEMANAGFAVEGIQEGNQLRLAALALGVPMNPGILGGLVLLNQAPAAISLEGADFQVLAPSQKSLKKLRKKWLDWLAKHEDQAAAGPQAAIAADTSVPNLSSIMALVTVEGKRLLMTGDGLGSDLLDGLQAKGLLDASGSLHVDLLKLPHHGSARNITARFFQKVTAGKYLISANGMYGNPDFTTLKWLVENIPAARRPYELIVTNRTEASQRLLKDYPPGEYGYRLRALPARWHSLAINI